MGFKIIEEKPKCSCCSSDETFVNLHVHSSFSLLDGMSRPEEIVNKVKSMNQKGFAITEHGNVHSSVKMYKLAKQNSLKFVYGCEFYICENRFEKDKTKKYYHLTVLAMNEKGRLNINKLVSLGYLEGFYFKPRIDFDLLAEHKEGLIIMSGCFTKDTKVLTSAGLKNIQDIETGELVMTHTGEYKKVLYPTVANYSRDIYTIKTLGSAFEISATDEHEFYVIPHKPQTNEVDEDLRQSYIGHDNMPNNRDSREKFKRATLKLQPSWKMAKDLTENDVILTPIDERVFELENVDLSKYKSQHWASKNLSNYNIKINNDLLVVLGLYVAEGNVNYHNTGVNFTIDSEKTDLISKIVETMEATFGINADIRDRTNEGRRCVEINFRSTELGNIFYDWFGGNSALTKRVPQFIMHLSPTSQMFFLKGACLGDGSLRKIKNSCDIRYSTSSKQLVSDLTHIYHRNMINPCLSEIKENITKDGVHHNKSYVLTISGVLANSLSNFIWNDMELDLKIKERRIKDMPFFYNGTRYARQKVKSTTTEKYNDKVVYCLNVESDHSFVAEGLAVHNCMASELQQTIAGGKIGDGQIEITSGNIERTKDVVRRYRKVFGENYYLEVQSHRDIRQQQLNRTIVDIAHDLGIQWVATADSHFVNEEDLELHKIFIAINRNKDSYENDETYLDTQIQSEKEAWNLLQSLTEEERDIAIRNTSLILDKCNAHIPLSAPLIPEMKIPPQFATQEDFLKYLCNEGWKFRKINKKINKDEYRQRLMYEFNAISEMGFAGYYLLVHGYANSVTRRGIARGSGGGSLVAYLLNIVDIDPIEHGLYFERFIDVAQLDMLREGTITRNELKIPDFDLDFAPEEREFIVKNIVEEHGQERVAALGQFGYIWDKSAIKDVGRVLNIPFDVTNKITKALDDDTIEEALVNGKLNQYAKEYPKLFDYAMKLAGLPRSYGMHPCGKIVTIDEVQYYTAVSEKDGQMVIQLDMKDAEALGLVKIDTLGLRTLKIHFDVLDMLGKDVEYIRNLDYTDPKVLAVYRNGFTDGVFQFESM